LVARAYATREHPARPGGKTLKASYPLIALLALSAAAPGAAEPGPANLLLNPQFRFHAFDNSREGKADSSTSGAVPCWDQDAYGDVQVTRSPRVTAFRPRFPVENVVAIRPGKRLSQFALLVEMGLDHGDRVSFSLQGYQTTPGALRANIVPMRLDSAAGSWSPAEFGQEDKRRFPRHARGELVRGPGGTAVSGGAGHFELKVENVELAGAFTESGDQSTDEPNTIGLLVELVSLAEEGDVFVYAPCLCRGATAQSRLPEARPLPTYYRGIPRTMQKLWRGEPLHIIAMGSSIDRGSANPPMYLYDEDPASPSFKQPLTGREFDGTRIGRPEWNDYIGWWQHHFMYTGRLRQALMRKFNYPMEKLLLNTMACDGSSISESHSGLADYATLAFPPDPNRNGHRTGKTWQELYPQLFTRPEGPRPDLVIFGSGANEKVDGADEVAAFEGAIRWFQRHYPDTEFLFCMFQNRERYTPNTGHLMELALRYQIPYIDFGRLFHLATRHCNSYALVPKDGHPQAAGHYLWFKQLERAFDAADPIEPGIAQLHLPERLSPYTIGWEGDMTTYTAPHPRIRQGTAFIFDDTVVNLWASAGDIVEIRLDGAPHQGSRRRPSHSRDVRNSTWAVGRLSLGDRHIVEVGGKDARLIAVDAKRVPGREWVGVESPRWRLGGLRTQAFASEWGAPYGSRQVLLPAGQSVEIDLPGTDFSIAYVDQAEGGTLRVEVDGVERLLQPTNVAFTASNGEALYLENRRGILGIPYGLHTIRVTALERPAALLGVFSYDTRPNRSRERVVRGLAHPGEVIQFTPPFRCRPLIFCTGGLQANPADVSSSEAKLSGTGPGSYEAIGE
jgi:hypothetical protein